ncbi:WD40 repeat domain-containing protein [Singulisphaera sp. Ch08]|uniref:WD40 repeat domain-containing protein n=1 Tax=Singulisphaera sp. Ch08 TaxID=3120278 RepID=A0AAU7CJU0_9BACT
MNAPAPAVAVPAGFDPKLAHVAAQWPTERPVVSCRFEPKGRFVFCGLESSTVQRFDLADGKRVLFPGGHDSWVFSFAFSADGATTFSGGGDGRITAWETAASTPQPVRKIEAHQGWIRALSVSPDGTLLASGGNDRMVRLWETATGKLVRELKGHMGHVYSLGFHPNGKTLLSGDLLGAIRQWDLATGELAGAFDAKPLHTYEGGQQVDFGGIRGLAITPDGKFVAAGGLHKATNPLGAVHEPIAILFDGESRKNVRTLLTDGITGGGIWRLHFLADGSLLGACGGSNGGLLLFWKTDADKEYHRFGLPNILRDMDVHPDGLRIASAHHDGHVRITRLAAKPA